MTSPEEIIVKAIKEKLIISFFYDGYKRVVQPHTLGYSKSGLQLSAFQVGGYSSNGEVYQWKRYLIDKMSHLQLIDETFKTHDEYKKGASFFIKIVAEI